jgi:hypothetical protein
MNKQVFNFKDVIVAAVVANRVNNGYVRETSYLYNDETGKYDIQAIGNKNIMRVLLKVNSSREQADTMKIESMNLSATQSDEVVAGEICEYLEGLAIKALTGELQGYEKSLYNVYEEGDNVTTYDFGLISSIPASFIRTSKQEKVELDILKSCADSKWFADKGSKVKIDVEIMNHIFSRNYNAHIYTCRTPEGNLVNFWSQKSTKDIGEAGDKITIAGKVKRQAISRFYEGIKETQLNYVKRV